MNRRAFFKLAGLAGLGLLPVPTVASEPPAARQDGRTYLGGEFTIATGATLNQVAIWNGYTWAQYLPPDGDQVLADTTSWWLEHRQYLPVVGA